VRVLGIDPGLRLTGYGCLDADDRLPNAAGSVVEAGVLRLVPSGGPAPAIDARLLELDRDLAETLERLRPDTVAVEALFAHASHPATAIKMAHARGVILLAVRRAGIELIELAPREIKRAITASGRASKEQIQGAVRDRLGLRDPLNPPDVADALAVALAAAARNTIAP